MLQGRPAWPAVEVRAGETANDYPIVRGFAPGAESSGLAIGDRLLRAGDADLRGVGPMGFGALVLEQVGSGNGISLVYQRDRGRGETLMPLPPPDYPQWRGLLLALGFMIPALIVFLRAPRLPATRALLLVSFFYTLLWNRFYGGPRELTYVALGVMWVAATVSGPLILRAVQLIPESLAPRGWWPATWPWIFALAGPWAFSAVFSFPFSHEAGIRGAAAVGAVLVATTLALATQNYRRSNPLERRQIKWVVYGFYVGTLPSLVSAAVVAISPRFFWMVETAQIATVLIPLAFLIAIIRFDLFDIDRLISTTASYSAVAVVLIGVGFAVVPPLAHAASASVGVDPISGQIFLSLLLAAVVLPAHLRLRPRIDRIFFQERHAVETGMRSLLAELSSCRDSAELAYRLGTKLAATLGPESCVVYTRGERTLVPVFVRGHTAASELELDSPLIAVLRQRTRPLMGAVSGGMRSRDSLDPFERATLEALGVSVVAPIRVRDSLAAFFCLGPKRTGDVYTPTDMSWLEAAADRAAAELLHLDQDQLLREARDMQQALRRYVPGEIAAELEAGRALESSEREVSVLFVDIRGYAGFAEGRTPSDIFSVVNRYTQTVSQIVHLHGGCVVEFNGDGMMAVFGAPRDLPAKEQAAVESGRQIIGAMDGMPVDDSEGPTRLSVGVGVATGEAFVGNIRAADRIIWSAIGNTTNLAARLQSLTRPLKAGMVIDRATWQAAGKLAADFELHERVTIRGRKQREDVYVLPTSHLPPRRLWAEAPLSSESL
jgi:class 3 adenylate cyclase